MGNECTRAVEAIAREQLGLIGRGQATEAGLHANQIQYRLDTGAWTAVHPGVYALAGVPRSWERDVLAATIACGPGTAGSHLTAASIHVLSGSYRRGIEVTVDDTTPRSLRGVVVHRSLVLDPHDLTTVVGIPVTSVARTLADCSGVLSLGQLARAVDDALVRDLVRRVDLEDVCSRLGPAPGRKISRLRLLLAERGVEADTAGSRPEMRLFRVLRAAGLPEPASQHPVRVQSRKFFIDAAYPDQRVALEYQGFDPHRTRTAFDADAKRTRLLTRAGWTVLYFTSKDTDADIVESVRAFVT